MEDNDDWLFLQSNPPPRRGVVETIEHLLHKPIVWRSAWVILIGVGLLVLFLNRK